MIVSLVSDTSSAAEQVRLEAIRRRAPEQRLADALALSESVRALALSRLRELHRGRPDIELVELMLSSSLGPPRAAGPAA